VKGKAMRNLLFAAVALATVGMTTASFAGGPGGGIGTPDSSSVAMSGSQSASANDKLWGFTVRPPSGGEGGYPARQSNGCPSLGDPQSTGGSRGLSC
jgi:hypothetical protein